MSYQQEIVGAHFNWRTMYNVFLWFVSYVYIILLLPFYFIFICYCFYYYNVYSLLTFVSKIKPDN